MRLAAEGHLTTEAVMWNQNEKEKTVSGMVTSLTVREPRERKQDI